MKIIISHDIDHLRVSEHLFDMIIPKFIIRAGIEFYKRKISAGEFAGRLLNIIRNKWQNIDELMLYEKSKNIPSTFFIGVNNGVGLSYNVKHAEKWIKKIIKEGFEIGVHGINYNNYEGVLKEFKTFKEMSGLNNFGIRMHYLRNDINTIDLLQKVGYFYDSSHYKIGNPYKKNNIWEFPLCIMDGVEIYGERRWQCFNVDDAIKNTIIKIEDADKKNLQYFSILFHDRYYDKSFLTWKLWFEGLIEYLKTENYKFISYKDAVAELENNKNL